MNITIKNGQLELVHTLLNKTNLKSLKANRGRVKLLKRVEEKFKEFAKDEQDILKEYAVVDEKGELIIENGGVKLKEGADEQELLELRLELINEDIVIKGGEYANRFNDYFKALESYEGDLDINELTMLDNLLDQYEQQLGGQNNGISN